ncbi:unnamed protein product [Sphagnum tenellum]
MVERWCSNSANRLAWALLPVMTHGYNAWGSSPRARFALRRPLNPLNTVSSSVPAPNGLGRPSITYGKNVERPAETPKK